MAWWMWALVVWATGASVAVLWLAAEVSEARSQELATPSADPLSLPWLPGTEPDPAPMIHLDPRSIVAATPAAISSIAAAARAALSRMRAAAVPLRPSDH
jgi:hypothetical protein